MCQRVLLEASCFRLFFSHWVLRKCGRHSGQHCNGRVIVSLRNALSHSVYARSTLDTELFLTILHSSRSCPAILAWNNDSTPDGSHAVRASGMQSYMTVVRQTAGVVSAVCTLCTTSSCCTAAVLKSIPVAKNAIPGIRWSPQCETLNRLPPFTPTYSSLRRPKNLPE